jgi:hypothetical protein
VPSTDSSEGPRESLNSFSVYSVDFDPPGEYRIDGRAFAPDGVEVARWWTPKPPLISGNGLEMTYIFDGTLNTAPESTGGPDRKGVVTVTLRSDGNTGRGRVDHVAERRQFDFDLFRVTSEWLVEHDLDKVVSSPSELRNLDRCRTFAQAYSRARSE